jgi:tRNA (guanine-N7-)-methyltransferase
MNSKKNAFSKPILVTAASVQQNKAFEGQARALFANPHYPLHVDVGIGKGQFLSEASSRYTHINWIGIEREFFRIPLALKKRRVNRNSNLKYIWTNYEQLPQVFRPGEVNRFYLNFAVYREHDLRKRLTHRRFLKMYQDLLAADGDLIFKTACSDSYQFSLQELEEMHWEIIEETHDFYNSPWWDPQKNVTSVWEDRYHTHGYPIHYFKTKPRRS